MESRDGSSGCLPSFRHVRDSTQRGQRTAVQIPVLAPVDPHTQNDSSGGFKFDRPHHWYCAHTQRNDGQRLVRAHMVVCSLRTAQADLLEPCLNRSRGDVLRILGFASYGEEVLLLEYRI